MWVCNCSLNVQVDGAGFFVFIFCFCTVGEFLRTRNIDDAVLPRNIVPRNVEGIQVKFIDVFNADKSVVCIGNITAQDRPVGSAQNPNVKCERERCKRRDNFDGIALRIADMERQVNGARNRNLGLGLFFVAEICNRVVEHRQNFVK